MISVRRHCLLLAAVVVSGIAVDARADDCDALSDRVTALSNKTSDETNKLTTPGAAVQFALDPQASNTFYCAEYDLNMAEAKLHRFCYQQLGYTKLRGEEKARNFESSAAAMVNLCKR